MKKSAVVFLFFLFVPLLLYAFEPGEKSVLKIADSPFFMHGGEPRRALIYYRNPDGEKEKRVSVSIYDINAYRVRTLVEYKRIGPGESDYVSWNGQNDSGSFVPMGIYIVYMKLECPVGGPEQVLRNTVVAGRSF
ncbi:MAG: hypothetical protein ACQESB_06055 [Elusimicrobiota bacterium]